MSDAQQSWEAVEAAAVKAFSPEIGPSAMTLVRAIERSVLYANVDESDSEIVLNRRAVLLGILSVGLSDLTAGELGNAAVWFVSWLQGLDPSTRAGLSTAPISVTPPNAAVLDAYRRQFTVVRSASMSEFVQTAVSYAIRTVKTHEVALRHLLAAMMVKAGNDWNGLADLGWLPTGARLSGFKRTLITRLEGYPETNEDMHAWRAIFFGENGDGESSSVYVPGFSSDRSPMDGRDPLGINADVQAFARLVCLQDATPPLSIAVFGGWGSGKSTFMERLESAVDAIAERERTQRAAAAAVAGTVAAPDKPRFVADVIQIRFNAWHFADSNLWASLSAEFFDQLRSGGYSRQGQAMHARLVEQVNSHVHSLSDAVQATHDAVTKGDQAVAAAQTARDKAVRALKDADSPGELSQTLLDAVADAYEQRKSDLAGLGLGSGYDIRSRVDGFLKVAREAQTFAGQVRVVVRFLRAHPWRFAGLAIIAVAAVLLAPRFAGYLKLATVGTALAAVGAILSPAIQLIRSVVASTATFADKLDVLSQMRIKEVVTREAELKSKTEEAKARRDAEQRATHALARYIDPQAATNPQRLLRFVLEDDPETQALEKEIGLISRARRLFQAVDEIVTAERRNRREGNPSDTAVPDRIVLYIDDLDRCTHDQVYAVLQAIHLLLAFELFVVVVGVDIRWIQESIAAIAESSRGDRPSVADDAGKRTEDARRRAIMYLEKIFQLPFWLRPLTADNVSGNSYGDYVRDLLESSVAEPIAAATAPRPNEPQHDDVARDSEDHAAQRADPSTVGLDDRAAGAEEPTLEQAFQTMTLTKAEAEFLATSAVGQLASKEPRGVKRMINVYRIARSRMSAQDRARLLGSEGVAPTYPILAVLAAVETRSSDLTATSDTTAERLYACLNGSAANGDPLPVQQGGLGDLLSKDRALNLAFEEVKKERSGRAATIEECAPLSRLMRRYSFNHYQ